MRICRPAPSPAQPAADRASALIRTGLETIGTDRVVIACSFSVEDLVVIDLLRKIAPEVGIFAIDTGRLHEETYEVAEALLQKYGLKIEWYLPATEALQALEREKGLFSFRESVENRLECCAIRKVEPLRRALRNRSGWITGQRRAQSATRTDLVGSEIDRAHDGILKLNPLFDWTDEEVWTYATDRRLPVNRLHRQGFPSIGCAPCTRAVKPGEDIRAGRWWWENPVNKECGLHR